MVSYPPTKSVEDDTYASDKVLKKKSGWVPKTLRLRITLADDVMLPDIEDDASTATEGLINPVKVIVKGMLIPFDSLLTGILRTFDTMAGEPKTSPATVATALDKLGDPDREITMLEPERIKAEGIR